MKNWFIQVLYLLLLAPFIVSCEKSTDNRISIIDKELKNLHTQGRFNGNILVAEKGEIIFQKSYGYADFDSQTPLYDNTIFDIGSISKPFTAVAIMMLMEQGKLDVEDPITKYFPELTYKDISIGHLLSHTSGIPEEQSRKGGILQIIKGKAYSNEQIKNVLVELNPNLDFEPGTQYSYSNTNYTLLALIVENVSKMSLPEFLKKNLFEPSQMTNTFFSRDKIPHELTHKVSKRFIKPKILNPDYLSTDHIDEISDLTWKNKYGGDKIHSTTNDLFKFYWALQNGNLMSDKFLNAMYENFRLSDGLEYEINTESNYPSYSGYSWRIAKDAKNGKIVHHAGGVPGGRSFMMKNISKDQFVILLTNNEETDRWTFTFSMRVLNNEPYKLDKIHLTKLFGAHYFKKGFDAALEKYLLLEKKEDYIPFDDWDFEDIGKELTDMKDFHSAIKLYDLYTQKYPKEHFSWNLLGEAYLHIGDNQNAMKNFRKALELNPGDEDILKNLKNIDH